MKNRLASRSISVGTRPSRLARWQTDFVIASLQAAVPGLAFRTVLFETHGDKTLDRPLPEIGGKGVFTEELENALRDGQIDLAVHSLKDLPIDDAPDLVVGAICEREDARDVLISRRSGSIEALPQGGRVGTSSLRRSAQLLALRPDLVILSLRGNVDTRLRKALADPGDYDAIVLASAGLTRLGLQSAVTAVLPFEVMLPAPGQGALAVQCRADDEELLAALQTIHHAGTQRAVTAERAFLDALGGGCSAPVAAYAEAGADSLCLTGLAASLDGRRVIRVSGHGTDPLEVGARLGREALAQGAGDVLHGSPER